MDVKVVSPGILTIQNNEIIDEICTDVLLCKIHVTDELSGPVSLSTNVKAVWDTGATHTMIPLSVVSKLMLEDDISAPVPVEYADHTKEMCYAYTITLKLLPSDIEITGVQGVASSNFEDEMLIGMDIISAGDFAFTNKGTSCFSFSAPSSKRIDFAEL